MSILRNLLYVDGFAGAIAGTLVLLTSRWLSDWYELPHDLLVVMGVANLAYASYSLSLAFSSIRPIYLILVLAAANLAWGVVCFGCAAWFAHTASPLGIIHLVGEGIFVTALAVLEYRWRELLRMK